MVGLVFCQRRVQVADVVATLDLRAVHLFLQVVKDMVRLVKDAFFDHLESVGQPTVHVGQQGDFFKHVLMKSLDLHVEALDVCPGNLEGVFLPFLLFFHQGLDRPVAVVDLYPVLHELVSHDVEVLRVVVRLDSQLANLVGDALPDEVLKNEPVELPGVPLELLKELPDGEDVGCLWLDLNDLKRFVHQLLPWGLLALS